MNNVHQSTRVIKKYLMKLSVWLVALSTEYFNTSNKLTVTIKKAGYYTHLTAGIVLLYCRSVTLLINALKLTQLLICYSDDDALLRWWMMMRYSSIVKLLSWRRVSDVTDVMLFELNC